ncbi:class II aldolase/adducin family protein [Patulibacter sp.]|uniref:class II aldolase/adducin family protein n=1 Tax=Patulibacter sp. TaxID=1912859 RepID=UPI0027209A2E|nr:class II aldolase/adducin family protein [Patulibacter sp.]MDO9407697.1 class II aldolase/adducin family protein [Patulibacter sp.]
MTVTTPSQEQQLVLQACRGLAANGLGPSIGGHVSVRVPGEERYWTNRLSRTFEEMQLDDIVLLDFEGRSVDPDVVVSPGIGFHHGIYGLRPDVGAIVHTHGYWVTAQSAFGREPRMLHNMSTYFHGRTAIAPDDEIDAIAPAMKDGDVAIIIPWHGAITLGATIAEAAGLHVTFDYACRLDVSLSGDKEVPTMPDDHAEAVQKLLTKANYLQLAWDLMVRKGERCYDGQVVVPAPAA